jgi:hypothetical protein
MELSLGTLMRATRGPIRHGAFKYYYHVRGGTEPGLVIAGAFRRWRVGRVVNGVLSWFGDFDTPYAALAELEATSSGPMPRMPPPERTHC